MASSFQKAILSDIKRSENPQAGHRNFPLKRSLR
jgi:hypothetical protein